MNTEKATTMQIAVVTKNELDKIKKHFKKANVGAVVELLLEMKEAKKILNEIEVKKNNTRC